MRVFNLIGAVRAPLVAVLSGGPLTIPGSVSPADQEAVITLLQSRGAQHPLRCVELDIPYGLTTASVRLLEAIAEGGWRDDTLLVLHRAPAETLRAVLDDRRVRRFPRVIGVVTHPGGDEDLSAWGELTREVRDALHAVFVERAMDLGVPSGALDAWRPFFDTLTNPCALVRVANDVVEESYLAATEPARAEVDDCNDDPFPRFSAHGIGSSRVGRGLVLHELAWRPWQEVLVLVALATHTTQRSEAILGAETHQRVLQGLEAQGLWHEEDGLRDWATRLETDDGWRDMIGEARTLPTPQQRTDGWNARCDDLCAEVAYVWLDPIAEADRSRFTARLDALYEAFNNNRPAEELRPLLDELAQRAPSEAHTPQVQAHYLYAIGRDAVRRGDYAAAIAPLEGALRLSDASMVRTRLLIQLLLGGVLWRTGQSEVATAVLERALSEGRSTNTPLHCAYLLFNLAASHSRAGNLAAELEALQECATLEARHGAPLARRASTLLMLGSNAVKRGAHEEALLHGRRAVEFEHRLVPAGGWVLCEALWLVCAMHIQLSQRLAAKEALDELIQLEARQEPHARRSMERIRDAIVVYRARFPSPPDAFADELAQLDSRLRA